MAPSSPTLGSALATQFSGIRIQGWMTAFHGVI